MEVSRHEPTIAIDFNTRPRAFTQPVRTCVDTRTCCLSMSVAPQWTRTGPRTTTSGTNEQETSHPDGTSEYQRSRPRMSFVTAHFQQFIEKGGWAKLAEPTSTHDRGRSPSRGAVPLLIGTCCLSQVAMGTAPCPRTTTSGTNEQETSHPDGTSEYQRSRLSQLPQPPFSRKVLCFCPERTCLSAQGWSEAGNPGSNGYHCFQP